jgi:hypothetical protein
MEADKKRGGVSMSAFRDFFLKDEHSFSAELLDTLDIKVKLTTTS